MWSIQPSALARSRCSTNVRGKKNEGSRGDVSLGHQGGRVVRFTKMVAALWETVSSARVWWVCRQGELRWGVEEAVGAQGLDPGQCSPWVWPPCGGRCARAAHLLSSVDLEGHTPDGQRELGVVSQPEVPEFDLPSVRPGGPGCTGGQPPGRLGQEGQGVRGASL